MKGPYRLALLQFAMGRSLSALRNYTFVRSSSRTKYRAQSLRTAFSPISLPRMLSSRTYKYLLSIGAYTMNLSPITLRPSWRARRTAVCERVPPNGDLLQRKNLLDPTISWRGFRLKRSIGECKSCLGSNNSDVPTFGRFFAIHQYGGCRYQNDLIEGADSSILGAPSNCHALYSIVFIMIRRPVIVGQ